jgi:sugar lactone lactonase YvrE
MRLLALLPAVDDTNVYWFDVFAQEVESAPLDGGTTRVLASSEPAAAGPVVVDDVALVWGDSDGRVRRVAKGP